MKANFETFSLAQIFAETQNPNTVLVTDCGGHDCGIYAAHSDWTWPEFFEDYQHDNKDLDMDCVERVALHDREEHGNLILARIKSGLYRVVGFNRGTPEGCFQRHEWKREARRIEKLESMVAPAPSKSKVDPFFTLGERLHVSHPNAVGN